MQTNYKKTPFVSCMLARLKELEKKTTDATLPDLQIVWSNFNAPNADFDIKVPLLHTILGWDVETWMLVIKEERVAESVWRLVEMAKPKEVSMLKEMLAGNTAPHIALKTYIGIELNAKRKFAKKLLKSTDLGDLNLSLCC